MDPRAAVRAAEAILDRAYGRPAPRPARASADDRDQATDPFVHQKHHCRATAAVAIVKEELRERSCQYRESRLYAFLRPGDAFALLRPVEVVRERGVSHLTAYRDQARNRPARQATAT